MASGQLTPRGVRCNLIDDALALQFGDGMSTVVPMEIIERSETLHASVTETSVEDGWVLDAPGRFVRDWLECLSFLGIMPSSPSALEVIQSKRVYKYLEACDYIADIEAVKIVSRYLGQRMFEACAGNLQYRRISGSNKEPAYVREFHEGLAELPKDLAISVIKASPASLDYQIESLPEELHHLALHAAYPNMLSEGSLSLDCGEVSLWTATAALRLFPNVAAQTALHVRSFHPEAVPGPKVEAFFLALDDAVRSGPSEVHIENMNMTAYTLESLLGALVANTSLKNLKLSMIYVHHISMQQSYPGLHVGRRHVNVPSVIAANISELTNLRQLVLRNDAETDGLASERVSVHSMQLPTLLTLLNFDHFGPVDADVLSSMLPPLETLQSLSLCFWADSDPIADRLASSLATLTKLTNLVLVEKDSISAWDPDRAHIVLPSLSLLPRVQKLDVSGCILDRIGVAHLLTAMPRFDHLTSLALKVTAVGTVTIAMLESLIANQQCEQLSLEAVWRNLPDAVRGELLCERLRAMNRLQSLRLKNCCVSETAGRGINEVFGALTNLTYLSLKQVFNTEPATGIDLRALDRLRKLAYLELDDSVDRGKFGEIDESDEASKLAFREANLRTVRLHMYQVPLQLSLFISRLAALTQLSVSSCLFARESFSVFCSSLETLSQLQELDLIGVSQRTFHGHIPPEPLAAAIQKLSSLRSLTLSRCGFGSHIGSLEPVLKDLADVNSLTYLSLKRMPLEASLSEVLVRTLSSLQQLEVLVLASCDVGDTCISAIAEGVSTLPRLRRLDLTENCMTDQGAESLATALYAVPSIRQVFIGQSRIRSEGARALLASVGDTDPTRCLEMVATCRSLIARWGSRSTHSSRNLLFDSQSSAQDLVDLIDNAY